MRIGSTCLKTLVLACALFGTHGISTAQSSDTSVRPTTAGVALAYPKVTQVRIANQRFEQAAYEIVVPIDLQISHDGALAGFSLVHAADSVFRSPLDTALKEFSFVGGECDGKPADQLLPVNVHLRGNSTTITLGCPVDDRRTVGLATDYAAALARNGAVVPRIARLGSYMYPNYLQAKPATLVMLLARMVLSASGRPKSIEIIHSTFPSLDDQIRALLNWATFDLSPQQQTKPVLDFYAAIVLHPSAQYPTAKVEKREASFGRAPEGYLVQLLPDTLGLLAPPLPRTLRQDSVVVAEADKKSFGRVAVNVAIDTLGQVTIERISRMERPVVAAVGKAMKLMTFYPALRFDGRPESFRGLIHLDFEGSTNIRVHPDWLRGRDADPIR